MSSNIEEFQGVYVVWVQYVVLLLTACPASTVTVPSRCAVVNKDLGSLPFTNLKTLQATVTSLDVNRRQLQLADGGSVAFDKLCICTGASPKVVNSLPPAAKCARIC